MASGVSIPCSVPMLRCTHWFLALLLSCVAQTAGALSYSALPFSGKVVDASTKQPLEGVIVVAGWRLEGRLGSGVGVLYSTESVTDHDGSFSMPGWGPLEVKVHADEEPVPARMSPNEPILFVFKPGYAPLKTALKYYDTSYLNDPWSTGEPVRAVANDRTLELRRWTQSDAIYNQKLIGWGVPLSGCSWARAPHMTIALIREGERLKDFNPTRRNEVLNPAWLKEDYEGQHCGSKKAILDEALK
jgi:hypothetical protein